MSPLATSVLCLVGLFYLLVMVAIIQAVCMAAKRKPTIIKTRSFYACPSPESVGVEGVKPQTPRSNAPAGAGANSTTNQPETHHER